MLDVPIGTARPRMATNLPAPPARPRSLPPPVPTAGMTAPPRLRWPPVTGAAIVFLTTFLASAVEAIEMVTIVVGVGVARGWRSTLLGVGAGAGVLAVAVAALGLALTAIPIGPLRVLVGTLLLLFGLQWYRKGIVRVAARGLAGYTAHPLLREDAIPAHGIDWTAWLVAFKGVLLEGLEVAFIVVSFGASARRLPVAIAGGAGAVAVVGVAALALSGLVGRIPRSLLQLLVGTMLVSFGTFWALEGLGVRWPQADLDVVALLAFYAAFAAAFVAAERRAFQVRPGVAR